MTRQIRFDDGAACLRARTIAAETPGLAAPFKGITTNGQIERSLFGIRSTGVSTQPVREAAGTFLAGLTQAQRDKSLFAVDDPEWRKWMNQSFYLRQGVSFLEMSSEQRDKAFGLLRASLSARGVRQTRDIMRLNETLGELAGNNFDEYGEWQYHITVMGRPSPTTPFGANIDRHSTSGFDWATVVGRRRREMQCVPQRGR